MKSTELIDGSSGYLKCHKCHGVGSYMYDDKHGKPCEICCLHDQGYWQLHEHYGNNNEKWCCNAGCGHILDKEPAQ